MTDKKLVVNAIKYPEQYFASRQPSLDDRIKTISLSEEEHNCITDEHSKKFIRDKVLGIFKIGQVVSEVINWNESIDEDIKKAKKEFLLSEYFNKNDKNENAIQEITKFLTNPVGNTLFNKVLRVIDDTPPDIELSNHLANALSFIIKSDFQKLFEGHKYALSQIESLTPQALTILANYDEYPIIPISTPSVDGGKLTSDWLSEFTQIYVNFKKINDKNIVNRVKNSINELISKRLIESHLVEENKAKCVVTSLGKDLIPYISK